MYIQKFFRSQCKSTLKLGDSSQISYFHAKGIANCIQKVYFQIRETQSTRARCNRGDTKSISYKQEVYFQFRETLTKECQIYHGRDIKFTKIKIYFQIQETLTKENQFYHNNDITLLMK